MTQEHPITPPPELVHEWSCDCPLTDPFNRELYVATLAARWGADKELEACCEWLVVNSWKTLDSRLLAARRPKPPSLRERALQAWAAVEAGTDDQTAMAVIRRALEALPE